VLVVEFVFLVAKNGRDNHEITKEGKHEVIFFDFSCVAAFFLGRGVLL
jgi:hypothetical protein